MENGEPMHGRQRQSLSSFLPRPHHQQLGHRTTRLVDRHIDRAGVENIHFIWAGSLEPGKPHHYLIQGPTFVVEYDNTQDDANHVHCVYRDFDNDFGDAMLEHYQIHHDLD